VASDLRSWKFCGEAVYDFVHAPPALYCGELQQFWVVFAKLSFCHCHGSFCRGGLEGCGSWKFCGEAVYDFVHAPPALYCGELQQFWVVFAKLSFCVCDRSFCHGFCHGGLEGRDLCRAVVCTFACVALFLAMAYERPSVVYALC